MKWYGMVLVLMKWYSISMVLIFTITLFDYCLINFCHVYDPGVSLINDNFTVVSINEGSFRRCNWASRNILISSPEGLICTR